MGRNIDLLVNEDSIVAHENNFLINETFLIKQLNIKQTGSTINAADCQVKPPNKRLEFVIIPPPIITTNHNGNPRNKANIHLHNHIRNGISNTKYSLSEFHLLYY